ncbi:MAG: DpnD/PcfM family protein [Paludibacteraceae bacterium]|nr:DpnD/PcfM family protein [Paludibacteraceae bacterium]
MKFSVEIEEILRRQISIDANSPEEAVSRVHRLYRDGKIVLSADDFIGEPTITCSKTSQNT